MLEVVKMYQGTNLYQTAERFSQHEDDRMLGS